MKTGDVVVVNGTFMATVTAIAGSWATVRERGTGRRDDYPRSSLEPVGAALPKFVTRLLDAARAALVAGEGFGRKAYLSDVCARMGTTPEACATLLRATRGMVELSRADLVEAMPAAKLAASQVYCTPEAQTRGDIGQCWHFVRVEP